MNERELREFITEAGKNPFRAWMHKLRDAQTRARIRVRLNRVRLGNFGDCKSVGEGVYELRIDSGPGYRIYLGLEKQSVVLLLCGGDKHTQVKDIATAKSYWKSYCTRKNK